MVITITTSLGITITSLGTNSTQNITSVTLLSALPPSIKKEVKGKKTEEKDS